MASTSGLLVVQNHTIKIAKSPAAIPTSQSPSAFLVFSALHLHRLHFHARFHHLTPLHQAKASSLLLHASLSASTPPASKEEAISQGKACLSTSLEKPLNSIKLSGKLKKPKQSRFRVEIPVLDDSPDSLSQLGFDVFGDLPIKRKGSPVEVLVLWPNLALAEAAAKSSRSRSSSRLQHLDISSVVSVDTRTVNSADVTVFLGPESSQLAAIKTVTDLMYPKPVVIFNPRWVYEDESEFGELRGFIGSFEVIYSFMGLEVRGLLNKRKGAIFKCVRDGVLSGEKWNVLVEEEGKLKVVSKFTARPSISEVENVLYNLMAVNSPITKSAKFLRNLVSSVSRKK